MADGHTNSLDQKVYLILWLGLHFVDQFQVDFHSRNHHFYGEYVELVVIYYQNSWLAAAFYTYLNARWLLENIYLFVRYLVAAIFA